MESCEPGQVRKEAALSGYLQARRERRTGVIKWRPRLGPGFDRGCTVHFLPTWATNCSSDGQFVAHVAGAGADRPGI